MAIRTAFLRAYNNSERIRGRAWLAYFVFHDPFPEHTYMIALCDKLLLRSMRGSFEVLGVPSVGPGRQKLLNTIIL